MLFLTFKQTGSYCLCSYRCGLLVCHYVDEIYPRCCVELCIVCPYPWLVFSCVTMWPFTDPSTLDGVWIPSLFAAMMDNVVMNILQVTI